MQIWRVPSLFSSVFQFAWAQATAGCKLPATDGHEDSQDVLLHKSGPGHVPDLTHRDPEDNLQPGGLREPSGL